MAETRGEKRESGPTVERAASQLEWAAIKPTERCAGFVTTVSAVSFAASAEVFYDEVRT